jgi:uncharacterized protein YjiS (DUF1127 family)
MSTMSDRTSRRAGHILGSLFYELWDLHQRHRSERLAIHQLRHLDDHLLRDIGLTRDGIDERVRTGPG